MRCLAETRNAVSRLAPGFLGISAVFLFGSVLAEGRFTPASDVDLAVDCDNVATESRFWQALEGELRFPVDLRPRQGAIAAAVEWGGECIYER